VKNFSYRLIYNILFYYANINIMPT